MFLEPACRSGGSLVKILNISVKVPALQANQPLWVESGFVARQSLVCHRQNIVQRDEHLQRGGADERQVCAGLILHEHFNRSQCHLVSPRWSMLVVRFRAEDVAVRCRQRGRIERVRGTIGYVFAIRSERMICREVQVNLAYRRYCRLGIEDKVRDHSAFSRARHERFRESDALRRVFERVVTICIVAGLVGGEAFSIDASLIKADVDKHKRAPGDQPIDWPAPEEASHAVRAYLAALDAARRDDDGAGGDGGGSSDAVERSRRRKCR